MPVKEKLVWQWIIHSSSKKYLIGACIELMMRCSCHYCLSQVLSWPLIKMTKSWRNIQESVIMTKHELAHYHLDFCKIFCQPRSVCRNVFTTGLMTQKSWGPGCTISMLSSSYFAQTYTFCDSSLVLGRHSTSWNVLIVSIHSSFTLCWLCWFYIMKELRDLRALRLALWNIWLCIEHV